MFRAVPDVAFGLWSAVERTALTPTDPFAAFRGPLFLISLASTLVGLITVFVLQAALLRGTLADLGGKRASFGDMLSTGFRFFLPLLGLAIVFGLAVGAASLLFIVPGIMLAVAWCAAAPSVVAERKGVFESLARSADLTRGHRWPIFGLFLIYAVVSWIIGLVAGAFIVANRTDFDAMMLGSVIFSAIIGSVAALIGGAGSASIYFELRTIKEGFGGDKLASVFD